MIGDDRVIESLRRTAEERRKLLAEVLRVMDAGGDFQCGPKGKHLSLRESIRKEVALAPWDANIERETLKRPKPGGRRGKA